MSTSVEKQIDNYLSLLDPSQKETVLNVVKTIAMAKQEYDNIWEDNAFVKEIEIRTEEYEDGNAGLYKFEEMKKVAIAKYKEKKSHKK